MKQLEIKGNQKPTLSSKMWVDKYGRLIIKHSETELAFKSISTIQWIIAGHLLLISGFCFYPIFSYFLEKLELSSLIAQPYLGLLFTAIWLQINAFVIFLLTILTEETK